ncbi:uncharacterized protein LY89DRAFT_742776 [Mollisia scopiformis]|uniref:2EXR domain-containing protein n=1 Tax=Mollisia scopiformis TaxID=149040 RepID=A0A132B558_MOLSC|nr:uncharacterized protein LY89DRAFT_742776 [Mollisia scopiformis]KUJ07548.1 hypothetical protein LY89DRAFT_742776 [Mollisia scopiformis]
MANDITALLGGLSFPTDEDRESDSFKLFPALPTELRLKVWAHALPSLTVLRLTAHILVSDPTFGFYLTFFMTVDGKATLVTVIPSMIRRQVDLGMYEQRAIALLRVSKESREVYLENFPISLPFALRGVGRLYMSRKEVLHFSNFSDLIHNRLFQQALKGGYRLQTWWAEIEKLAIPITSLIVKGKDWEHIPALCQRLPALTELKGVMWDRFQDVIDNGNAEGTKTIKDAMNAQLRNAEHELSRYRDENDQSLVVPEIRLMPTSGILLRWPFVFCYNFHDYSLAAPAIPILD